MEGTQYQALAIGQLILDHIGAHLRVQTREAEGEGAVCELWVQHAPSQTPLRFSVDEAGVVTRYPNKGEA